MNTPMTRTGSSFVTAIQVPSGSAIDFGFLITKSLSGTDLAVWDGDGAKDYHRVASRDGTIEVRSRATLFQSGRWNAKEEANSWGYLGLVAACALFTLLMGGSVFWYRHHTRVQDCARHITLDRWSSSRTVDLTLFCVSLLAAFGIAEYGLRVLTPHGGFGAARELDWMRSDPTSLRRLFTIDSTLGFRPNLQGELYNELGTRRNGYALEKRPGVSRLLFIGDSVTFRGTIIDALRKVYGEEHYEYWNAGVESYNTVQEVKFYTSYNSGTRPDHVILTFHPNDFETTPVAFFNEEGKLIVYAPNLPLGDMSPWLFEHSYLYRFLIGLITSERRGQEAILEEIRQSLTILRDTLQHDHIRLTVLILPLLTPDTHWSSDEHGRRKAIIHLLSELQITHIDLLQPMTDALKHDLIIQETPGDTWHPSEAVSKVFAKYLQQEGLLGQRKSDEPIH